MIEEVIRPRNFNELSKYLRPRLDPKKFKVLDVGIGTEKKGTIGMDLYEKTDINWDIRKQPFPLESESFDEVFTNATLEFVQDIQPIIEEFHRILKPNGLLTIGVPHYLGVTAWLDPDHKSWYSEHSFSMYLPDRPDLNYRTKTRFEIEKIIYVTNFHRGFRILPFFVLKNLMVNGLYGLIFYMKKCRGVL